MRRFAAMIVAASLAACAGSPSPVIAPSPLPDIEPALKVEQRWSRGIDSGAGKQFLRLGPVLSEGRLYAASRFGHVRALLADTGDKVWETNVGTAVGAGPVVAGDLVLLAADAQIVALDVNTGEMRWRAPVSSESLAEPVRSGDIVVARTVDGAVYGLDATDGRQLWRVQQSIPLLSLRGLSAPVIEGDSVYVGFSNGRVAAYALSDGALQWEAAVSSPRGRTELERLADVDGRLAVGDGVMFVAGYQGRVAALALATGRGLWAREVSSYQGIALADRELYVTDDEGDLWALAQQNGGTLWHQTVLHGRRLSLPVVQGDWIVVGDYEGYLHWFSREEGRLLASARILAPEEWWPYPSESESFLREWQHGDRSVLSAPVVEGDTVYAVDKRGAIGAFQVTQ